MGYSHYDIAHAWAHGLDSCHGYCSQSMSHYDGKLKSYSTVIGQRIERPGQYPLWLVQFDRFSSSTSKHQSYMRNAMTYGPVVDVSKYGGKYGWDGVSCYGDSKYTNNDLERLCIGFIESFYSLLACIPDSKSISSEDIATPINEINTLIEATSCTTWKKLAAHQWSKKHNRQKAIHLRKLTIALEYGNMSIPQLVVAVFGEKAWSKHIALTLPQQKARETRRKKENPNYTPIDFNNVQAFDFAAEVKAARERQRREAAKRVKEGMKRVEKWLNGEGYYFDSYGLPSDAMKKIYNGGNVLLRINDGHVETSKGIHISFEECERLWLLIKRWHKNNTEFRRDICHATVNNWTINSFKDDIMVAGCHLIAYSEMERIAKQLKFD